MNKISQQNNKPVTHSPIVRPHIIHRPTKPLPAIPTEPVNKSTRSGNKASKPLGSKQNNDFFGLGILQSLEKSKPANKAKAVSTRKPKAHKSTKGGRMPADPDIGKMILLSMKK